MAWRRNNRWIVGLGMVSLALIGACDSSRSGVGSKNVAPTTVTTTTTLRAVDVDGDTVRLDRAATRVIALIPSATDLVAALGDTAAIVGRTRYDRDAALSHIPSVGGGLDPDLEQLTALHPDLVLTWEGSHTSRVARALAEEHIPIYAIGTRDTTDFFHTTEGIGHLLGRDSAARALMAAVRDTFAMIHASVAGRPTPSVMFLMWGDPPMTIGPHVFLSQLIGIAGGRTAFNDASTDWPKISMEEIVRRAPDVIVLSVGEDSAQGAERLRTTPGWRTLPAVREGHVATISADLVDRPGPHMAEIARRFRDIIHPETAGESAGGSETRPHGSQ